jgi:hypothetical protein
MKSMYSWQMGNWSQSGEFKEYCNAIVRRTSFNRCQARGIYSSFEMGEEQHVLSSTSWKSVDLKSLYVIEVVEHHRLRKS